MSAIVIGEQVRIPAWVTDLESFRRWGCSGDFPEHGWFSHLKGELWVDVNMETLAHNQLKGIIAAMLTVLVRASRLGRYIPDRMLLTNLDALLSTEPDGMFVSNEALESERVLLREGDDTLEIVGTPDMVLEVVSKTSVQKDTVVLRDLYWQAGIPEYWLVDARGKDPSFEILHYGASKYISARKQAGWCKSSVFGKLFKLVRQVSKAGLSEFDLLCR